MLNTILKKRAAAKKNQKKGFTLIEVIVVIVIVAILAAIAVPSLVRYIGSAEKQSLQATAHNIQVVLQAEATEKYKEKFVTPVAGPVEQGQSTTAYTPKDTAKPDVTYQKILGDNGVTLSAGEKITNISWDGATLSGFTFENDTYIIEYTVKDGFKEVAEKK